MDRFKKKRSGEKLIKGILFLFGAFSVFITLAILITLLYESGLFFQKVSFKEFFTGRQWSPLLEPRRFGVLPIVMGTFLIVFFSSLISIPIGFMSAVYLSEYSNKTVRKYLKPVLELLAGIPSIVYGYFALSFITPLLRGNIPNVEVFNALSASIAVGVMTIPMVLSMSEDAMQAVPSSLREGAYALGMTKFEVITSVVIPSAISGIMASFVLAISRAIGETMIVALAAGSSPKLTLNPLVSIQTITGFIVQVATGDSPKGSIQEQTLYAVALLLFLLTLSMNILSNYISKKYREVY